MIKANELRFDNFVLYEGEYKQIKSMWDFDYLDDFEPIPLTEEILLKCDKNNERFMVDKIGFVIFKNSLDLS